jgi:hypothetical protein
MRIATAIAAFALMAASANAATVTETYDFTGDYAGEYYKSVNFTSNMGNTVNVTMGLYTSNISDGTAGGGKVGQWTGAGLGVCGNLSAGTCQESHYVDGSGANEFLAFVFDKVVTLASVTFGDYSVDGSSGEKKFDLWSSITGDVIDISYNGSGSYDPADYLIGSVLKLGAFYSGSGFKVKAITVTYETGEVPLPAAGLMLIGALGGMSALRRRKRG